MTVLPHTETNQLTCRANQLTGIYMRATLAFYGLTELCILEVFVCLLEFYQ